MSNNHQIIISGLGGQGVLFITKLLAGAAMANDLPVMTSETHGMAQRGGNVISYLKIGDFSGPLIRPGQADGMIALKAESFYHHGYFLNPEGVCVVNSPVAPEAAGGKIYAGDASAAALAGGAPGSVNVVMLGFFLAAMAGTLSSLTLDALARVVADKFHARKEMAKNLLALLSTGYNLYEKEK